MRHSNARDRERPRIRVWPADLGGHFCRRGRPTGRPAHIPASSAPVHLLLRLAHTPGGRRKTAPGRLREDDHSRGTIRPASSSPPSGGFFMPATGAITRHRRDHVHLLPDSLPTHPRLRHPLTGEQLRAIGVTKSGKAIWLVMGGSQPTDEPAPAPAPASAPAPGPQPRPPRRLPRRHRRPRLLRPRPPRPPRATASMGSRRTRRWRR